MGRREVMLDMRTITARAALFFMGAALLLPPAPAKEPSTENGPQVSCSLSPAVLDVHRPAGPLVARIEIFSPDGLTQLATEGIEPGVYVSSVGGVRLPLGEGLSEGISESRGTRSYEDVMDVGMGALLPNGVQELVVRFVEPCDGDPSTRDDGNAGDVLAMMMGTPDGESVEVCVAGRHDGLAFECCDTVTVRNRGLREIPRGLLPAPGGGHP